MFLEPKIFQIAFLAVIAIGFALNAYEIHMFRKDLMTLEELSEEENED